LAVVDQITGKTRLILGDDQGIFTSLVNAGNDSVADLVNTQGGSLAGSPDAVPTISGNRNGNMQITQFYYGAVQPRSLAAEIQGALLYGMAQDDGFPISTPDVLRTGNIGWVGPAGDGTGVATDQTGSGQVYEYRWPCCGAFPLPEDFFLVQLPHHQGQDFISRVTGLLNHQPGDFPMIGGSNFTVNPIDPT